MEASAGMGHDDISQDRLFYFETHDVVVSDFEADGYVLDLGGGGEGIIGRLKPDQVVAIDPNERELAEAAAGPLKVVMDARDLRFLEATFSAATSFFTLMYIPGPDHATVFDEVFRVLVPGGSFFIWDASLPLRGDREEDFAVFPLAIKLPSEEVSTGYGTRWPAKVIDLDHYHDAAESSGFEVVAAQTGGRLVKLHLRKPASAT